MLFFVNADILNVTVQKQN